MHEKAYLLLELVGSSGKQMIDYYTNQEEDSSNEWKHLFGVNQN